MPSAIDATKPVAGSPTTESVRLNFAAAKSEIELLQQTAGVGPKGDKGDAGPAGTVSVGTVTTGAAGTSATVTNIGSPTAATLNFTIPRGDAGTGGGGITETQAKNAVRQGNIQFLESPETSAVTFPTTPNLAQPPVVGANWTPQTGGTATQAYTHDIGSTETLAYPVTIASGTFYQIVLTLTNVSATSTVFGSFFSLYFRTAPTVTTDQQTVMLSISGNATITIQATGAFTHLVVAPHTGWQGNFTLTRVVAFTGAQNSASLSVKDWIVRARGTSIFEGGGGRLATSDTGNNIALGRNALDSLLTATGNVAIGTNALLRNSTGSNNTAIGTNALQNNQYGYSNVAIGQGSMNSSQTGYNNTAVGGGSLSIPHTGYRNAAFGLYALYENVGQSIYNTALGEWALGWVRGNNNTAVGCRALSPSVEGPTLVVGSNVTALGFKAGAHIPTPGNMTAAENCLFLGANTKASANDQHNEIVIGYNAVGHGSDTITLGNSDITELHCQVQTISALSDSRIKEDIQPANLDMCLDVVKKLPVSRWGWQSIAGVRRDKHVTGFLADDVRKVFPKAVTAHDEFLPVRDSGGKAEMIPVTESASSTWKPEGEASPTPAAAPTTRLVEKTVEIKDLQYVSLTEALPTLWGAVQRLIQEVEELRSSASPEAKSPTVEEPHSSASPEAKAPARPQSPPQHSGQRKAK